MWVQRQTAATPFGGTPVTLNDTAPTNDRWNLAAVEVLPAVTDTQAADGARQPRRGHGHGDAGPALLVGEHRRPGRRRLPDLPRRQPGRRSRRHQLHRQDRRRLDLLHLHRQGLRRRRQRLRRLEPLSVTTPPPRRHHAARPSRSPPRPPARRCPGTANLTAAAADASGDRRRSVPARRQSARSRGHLLALRPRLGLDHGRRRIAHARRARPRRGRQHARPPPRSRSPSPTAAAAPPRSASGAR